MREAIQQTINGRRYTIGALTATAGLAIVIQLIKLLGPSLEPLAATLPVLKPGENLKLEDLKIAVVAKAVNEIATKLESETVAALVKKMLSVAQIEEVGNAADRFDVHYAGNYGELFGAITAVINHNFTSFFDLLDVAN